jgi:hypothetical protein
MPVKSPASEVGQVRRRSGGRKPRLGHCCDRRSAARPRWHSRSPVGTRQAFQFQRTRQAVRLTIGGSRPNSLYGKVIAALDRFASMEVEPSKLPLQGPRPALLRLDALAYRCALRCALQRCTQFRCKSDLFSVAFLHDREETRRARTCLTAIWSCASRIL